MIYIIFTNKLFHYLKEKVIIMRKITLLVLLFAVVGNIKAAHYEYIPLVRDGVEWGYSQQLFGKSYYRNLIQADTITLRIKSFTLLSLVRRRPMKIWLLSENPGNRFI